MLYCLCELIKNKLCYLTKNIVGIFDLFFVTSIFLSIKKYFSSHESTEKKLKTDFNNLNIHLSGFCVKFLNLYNIIESQI